MSAVHPDGYALKRPFDIIISALGLILSSPLWVLIAIAILAEDGPPVFYPSTRVGRGGRRFRTHKFRTMIAESDSRYGPLQAGERDERVTAVGRVIRPAAMDELPQLWSIFRGEMSFVGPRALLPEEIELKSGSSESIPIEDIPGYEERQSARPGLTGLAQIYAPRDIVRKNKFRYDLVYVRNPGLWLDLRLIFLSFWITLRGKWETRAGKL